MNMKSTLFAMLAVMTMIFSMTGLHIDSAWSADLRSAKAAGQIGEQPDGYLGIVSSASADVQALVSDINQKRRDAYQGIANSNGTSLNAVEILAGKKAIEKTPAGEYVRTAAGEWIKK